MAISILPALLGWAALLLPTAMAAWLLLAGFVVVRAWEASPPVAQALPAWCRTLRTRLTLAVCTLLVLFALAAS